MHTHETSWIGLVSPNLPINKDMTLHQNGLDFTISESILQLVSQYKDQRQAFSGFMGSR